MTGEYDGKGNNPHDNIETIIFCVLIILTLSIPFILEYLKNYE